MNTPAGDPGGYARLVRSCPYGPRELTVAGADGGGVTAWFHGPFVVLTITGSTGGAVTVRAGGGAATAVYGAETGSGDTSPGDDLVVLFDAANRGVAAELPRPERLVCEHWLAAGQRGRSRVHGLTLRPVPDGTRVTLTCSGPAGGADESGQVTEPGHATDARSGTSVREVGTVLGPPGAVRLTAAIREWAVATRR